MSAESIVALIVAAVVVGYLVYALLAPERL